MESGFRDLNVQFLDYIQTLFTENDGEDLSDRLRALVEEYDKHAETLIEEAGGKGQREEDEEETAAAHDADEDGDEGGDEDNGDETVQGSPAQEGNFFGRAAQEGPPPEGVNPFAVAIPDFAAEVRRQKDEAMKVIEERNKRNAELAAKEEAEGKATAKAGTGKRQMAEDNDDEAAEEPAAPKQPVGQRRIVKARRPLGGGGAGADAGAGGAANPFAGISFGAAAPAAGNPFAGIPLTGFGTGK